MGQMSQKDFLPYPILACKNSKNFLESQNGNTETSLILKIMEM